MTHVFESNQMFQCNLLQDSVEFPQSRRRGVDLAFLYNTWNDLG